MKELKEVAEMPNGADQDTPNAPEEKEPKSYDKWEISGAADDLMRAEKHKKKPKLMKAVASHLEEKKRAITSIQQLRELSKKG